MRKKLSRREFLESTSRMVMAAGLGGSGMLLSGCRTRQTYDVIISGGRVFDGLGGQAVEADIGIIGDEIAAVGKIAPSQGKLLISAKNLAVCPGFIDTHDHSDIGLLVNPRAESHIQQGITTVVSGNCGSSPFPIANEIFEETKESTRAAYGIELTWRDINGFFSRLEASGIALNYATFVGQGAIRGAAMGFNDRPPKPHELERMKSLVAENIQNGALGISSGLEYAPGSFAQPQEIVELCKTAAFWGGLYSTHMRDEGDRLLEALEETIEVARETGIGLQISHFKIAYPRNWHKTADALHRLETAERNGIAVFCDRYPYIAGSSGFSSFNFPLWAKQGTTKEFLDRLKDPALEGRLRKYVREREAKLGSWDKVLIASVASDKNRRFEGQSVLEGMQTTGKDAFEFMRDLIIEEKDQVTQIIFMMNEDNLKKILAHPLVGVGCDGSALAPYGPLGRGKPHPRNYGTFPRVLGKYVRKEKILPLPAMLKKMTSQPAQKFGFSRRGVLREGYLADIVIFDEDRIMDRATWKEPHQFPVGIDHVIVNGQCVIREGEHSGNLPGRILKSIPGKA